MVDAQVTMYFLAAQELGYDIETIIYDVLRKPCIEPLKATPIEDRKYRKTDGLLYANQREFDETPDEWGDRLYADICERPDFYYGRREIPRLEQDLATFRFELWDIAKDIRQAQLGNRWYRNMGTNCDQCDPSEICYGFVPWDGESVPAGFQRLDDPNPELKGK